MIDPMKNEINAMIKTICRSFETGFVASSKKSVNVTKTIKVAKDVTDEKVEALWICPMCKTQIHQVFKDLSDQWYGEESGEEVLLEGSTDKVTKVKDIREKFN